MTIQESDKQVGRYPDVKSAIRKPVDLQFNKLQRVWYSAENAQRSGTKWTRFTDRIVRFFIGDC